MVFTLLESTDAQSMTLHVKSHLPCTCQPKDRVHEDPLGACAQSTFFYSKQLSVESRILESTLSGR